ncbi:hypothetical protein V5799_030997 [Amblyomma americanum]|uniref:Uncharacterized protein n=1 Tax=Amblyomma americanum TaxID=6943 RepID=A0AAQ4ELK9_AMBAM
MIFLDAVHRLTHRYAIEAYVRNEDTPDDSRASIPEAAEAMLLGAQNRTNDLAPEADGRLSCPTPAKRLRPNPTTVAERQRALAQAVRRPALRYDPGSHFANYAGRLMTRMKPSVQMEFQKEKIEILQRHLEIIE